VGALAPIPIPDPLLVQLNEATVAASTNPTTISRTNM